MENYMNKVQRYIDGANEEPDKDTEYILGLENSLLIGKSVQTAMELVKGLTTEVLLELKEDEPSYIYIRGVVASLKVALKLEGIQEIPTYKVITPVHQIVKDANGKVMPVKYVEGDYDEYWTMPEILAYDVSFVEYAVGV